MATVVDKFDANAVGLRTTSGRLTYDLATKETHTIELDPKIHALDEAVPGAPILGISNKIGSPKTVRQPIYFMLRKKQLPRFITLGGAYTAGDGAIVLTAANAAKLKKGYYVLNTATRVMWRMEEAPDTSTTCKVVGSVADADGVAADDELLILGYRGAERDAKFLDFIRQPDIIFNYVGELQKVYGISQYEQASGHLSGHDPLAVLRMDKLQEMRLDLELGILFDQRGKDLRDDDSRVVYTTGGIDSFATENETDFAGSVTEAKIRTAARAIARHGPNDRWCPATPLFMENLEMAYVEPGGTSVRQWNDRVVGPKVGIDITTLRYSGLNLHFFVHPLFDDASEITYAINLKDWAYILDLDDMNLVTMKGDMMGFFKWKFRVETPGAREREDQLICNFGVKMTRPEHYGRWFDSQ
jgi:hypothetical protein